MYERYQFFGPPCMHDELPSKGSLDEVMLHDMVEVFDIIAAYGVNYHCYADDMQVYAGVPATMADAE